MDFEKVLNFYKGAISEGRISEKILSEAKAISDEADLKKFIKEKLLPMSKDMGYELTVEDLLAYEEDAVKHLSEEELESVTGGIGAKNWVLGGLLSVAAVLGGGAALNASHAMMAGGEPASSASVPANQTQIKTVNKDDGTLLGTFTCTYDFGTHRGTLTLQRADKATDSQDFSFRDDFSVDRFLDNAEIGLKRGKSATAKAFCEYQASRHIISLPSSTGPVAVQPVAQPLAQPLAASNTAATSAQPTVAQPQPTGAGAVKSTATSSKVITRRDEYWPADGICAGKLKCEYNPVTHRGVFTVDNYYGVSQQAFYSIRDDFDEYTFFNDIMMKKFQDNTNLNASDLCEAAAREENPCIRLDTTPTSAQSPAVQPQSMDAEAVESTVAQPRTTSTVAVQPPVASRPAANVEDIKVYHTFSNIINVGPYPSGHDANISVYWLEEDDKKVTLKFFESGSATPEGITIYLGSSKNKQKLKELFFRQVGERMSREWDTFNFEEFVKKFIHGTAGVSFEQIPDYLEEYIDTLNMVRDDVDIRAALASAGIQQPGQDIFVRFPRWENAYNMGSDGYAVQELGGNKFRFLNLVTGEEREYNGGEVFAKICIYDPNRKTITKIVDLSDPSQSQQRQGQNYEDLRENSRQIRADQRIGEAIERKIRRGEVSSDPAHVFVRYSGHDTAYNISGEPLAIWLTENNSAQILDLNTRFISEFRWGYKDISIYEYNPENGELKSIWQSPENDF